MKLSAKIVKNFANVNNFDYANQWEVRSGDPNTLYFQLVDLDQAGLRYLAGIGGANQPFGVVVTFPSVDTALVLALTAVQADANDSSLWKVTLSSSQKPNSGIVRFTVTEGSNARNFNVLNAISVEFPFSDGSC